MPSSTSCGALRRPEVVKALAAAAAEGDRSENAEYTYRKKQLGEIDRRVRYLSKRLEALKVRRGPALGPGVPSSSAPASKSNWPMAASPPATASSAPTKPTPAPAGSASTRRCARAALRKRVDDEFEVVLPAGPARYVVVSVSYPASP